MSAKPSAKAATKDARLSRPKKNSNAKPSARAATKDARLSREASPDKDTKKSKAAIPIVVLHGHQATAANVVAAEDRVAPKGGAHKWVHESGLTLIAPCALELGGVDAEHGWSRQ